MITEFHTPRLTRNEQLRLRLRLRLERLLEVVPLSLVEVARKRRILVPLLRHRRIAALNSFTVEGPRPVKLMAVDSHLTRMLYWQGPSGYEGNEVAWWCRFCQQATAVLELGANIGYYTAQGALAAPLTPYTAVEAHPETVQFLQKNLNLNSASHVKVLHGAVVGDPQSDSLELALPDQEQYEAPTGAFLATGTEGVGARRAAHRTVSVPALGVTGLIAGIDVIKLDIEGAEYDVLHAVEGAMLDQRAIILVEVLRDTPQLRSLLVNFERNHHYGIWLVSEAKLRRVLGSTIDSGTDLLAKYGSRDVALIPDERLASLTP